jgi:NADPH-dependent 2,4-dienoyl-CoA reductase/sulfur reductase-like enzyme
VVIGGDAGGMAAASQLRRLQPDAEIVVLEKGRWTSYSACGIPYLIGGQISALDHLVARTPEEFRAQRIDVRMQHEATAIDLDARTVEVHNLERGRTFALGFAQLHLATGATPRRPEVPGIDGPHVHAVQTLADAASLLADAEQNRPQRVCVIGVGYIGLELAESFLMRGAEVTVVDRAAHAMASLDADMGALVAQAMRRHGITMRLEESVMGIDHAAVTTNEREIPADLVILGTGVRPNTTMLGECGIPLGSTGGVVVDRRQQTSIPGVFAAGDCCESRHLVSGKPVNVALGTYANKQGRVAGINMGGGYATFPGVAGTAVTKLCATEIGRTGLNESEASAAGFEYVSAKIDATTWAGYLDGPPITVKMLAERRTGRVLGAQIVGGSGAAKRIDVVATALAARMTADDVAALDLGYAPPFSTVWDPVAVAARQLLGRLTEGGASR